MGQSGLHGKQLNAWNSHGHCYETSQIIKIRVIVLQGNRGMVLLHRMSDLRSHPPWFPALLWGRRKYLAWADHAEKENKGNGISRRHQWEEPDHRVNYHFTHAVCSHGRAWSCWQMCLLRYRVSTLNKRLLHSKHGDVSATWSANFKEPKGQPKCQRWTAR